MSEHRTARDILRTAFIGIGEEIKSVSLANTDFTTHQMKKFLNAAGQEIARRGQWPRLAKTQTINADTPTPAPLPPDFGQIGAVYLDVAPYSIYRPVTDPIIWGFLKNRPSIQPYYHLKGGKIMFAPEMQAETAIRLDYFSKNWVAGGKSALTTDEEQVLIPATLLITGAEWRWKRNKGVPYQDTLGEFEAAMETELQAEQASA